MKKLFESLRKFHGYKTQYDYYRTSGVMHVHFGTGLQTVHDKINYRSMYIVPKPNVNGY